MKNSVVARQFVNLYRRFAADERRVLAGIVNRARRIVVRWYDPDVTIEFPDGELTLPLSHDLPFTRADHPGYGDNLNRTIDCVAERHERAIVVDIGANVGDTVVMAYRPDVEFICIEGHPDYYDYLLRNTAGFDNVTTVLAMVGRAGDVLALSADRGTAVPTQSTSGVPTESLERIAENATKDGAVDLVKIDTDGYDGTIIESCYDWLNAQRPALFFEYAPYLEHLAGRPMRPVVGRLVEIGYRWLLIWDKEGDLMVAVEGDEVMDDLDQYVRRGFQRYLDICMTDDAELFEILRTGERRAALASTR